eukprot:256283-Alexandrium_andersonii.AAC.1
MCIRDRHAHRAMHARSMCPRSVCTCSMHAPACAHASGPAHHVLMQTLTRRCRGGGLVITAKSALSERWSEGW